MPHKLSLTFNHFGKCRAANAVHKMIPIVSLILALIMSAVLRSWRKLYALETAFSFVIRVYVNLIQVENIKIIP